MSYRDPVPINVNYFYAFADTPLSASERAAAIVTGALSFRELVNSETLEPDTAKGKPLCMRQYSHMFNSTRVPFVSSDITHSFPPMENNFIVVVRKNTFYKLDLELATGQQLSTAQLKVQFDKIYSLATKESPPVGALTTENRDVWLAARNSLLSESQINVASIDTIERAAFIVCLDDTSPVTKNEISRACWHGDGRNRFFDKSMQFVIFDNGKAGALKVI